MSAIGMETIAARLATFYATHELASKGRISSSKVTAPVTWPHGRPSPEELAHAGFYYRPTPLSLDNAACFLCERALDGWEEDDDPVTEHLKHSSECGWAIMMDIVRRSSNPAEIEDPTSARIVEARRATFGSMWPHDGKRGWVCKTEKLVEAGWYFCANEESDDFVSCAYCKLSLDGWEPKDDPFDEHYRRSSDCSFFHFALKQPAKPTRGKKTRASKASRLSTQSIATTLSEAPELDFDDEMDHSTLSQSTNKTSKKARKAPKSKGKKTKSKKRDSVEVSSQVDMESNNGDGRETSRPKRATRGKKRKSDAMNEAEEAQNERGAAIGSEPPAKRRTTRSENIVPNGAVSPAIGRDKLAVADEQSVHEEPPPPKSRKSKRASSTARKPPGASKASFRSKLTDDYEEIYAQLEAGLAEDVADDASAAPEIEEADEHSARKRHNSTTSVASAQPPAPKVINTSDLEEEPDIKAQKPQRKKNVGRKKPTAKKYSRAAAEQVPASLDNVETESIKPNPRASTRRPGPEEKVYENMEMEDIVVPKDPGDDSNLNSPPKPAPKRVGRPKGSTGTSKKSKQQPQSETTAIERAAPISSDLHGSLIQNNPSTATHTTERKVMDANSKNIEPQADPETQKSTDVGRKVAFKAFRNHDTSKQNCAQQRMKIPEMVNRTSDRTAQASHTSMPANAYAHTSTPSASPQSSDAENRPPSNRPSNTRPASSSASKPQAALISHAANTPITSTSKIGGQLVTSHPWNSVDPEEIFLSDSTNKGSVNINDVLHAVKGDLTSPEKKMTVEEWIMWNAKNGEIMLRNECERLVGIFEREGGKAMMALEGIECTE
ncbi:hypothetical protein AJ78_01063 [Emergomyces pasteurianus Ep9510]|uniref:Uncharacterized protein n=1 Tax=Emergomyces pasteurianus Ep9510 TaxID=1447872 RepID=A0A1J9QRY7_9EURO|nr:hypothetical protein AJ78_01063 [Emergomyces pasteurianus Ep9510]